MTQAGRGIGHTFQNIHALVDSEGVLPPHVALAFPSYRTEERG